MDNKIENPKKDEIKIDISKVSNLNAVKGSNPSIDMFTEKAEKPSRRKKDPSKDEKA